MAEEQNTQATTEPTATRHTYVEKGHKGVTYLQKCKDQGKKLVQYCPVDRDAYFSMAAEMADLDICRLIAFNSPARFVYDVHEKIAASPYTIKIHHEMAPNMHINFMMETPCYINKEDAVKYGCDYIQAGADSFLTMGISNEVVRFMADNYVPTFSHIGIISGWQTVSVGGYHRVGRTAEEAMSIYRWGYEYQESGMSAMTIEMTPIEVSAAIAKKLRVPVISIAGGAACDGSEMVDMDLFGMNPKPASHAKTYANFFEWAVGAYAQWAADVRSGAYPEDKHGWHMNPEELEKFLEALDKA
jgi:3-methyl-2-oxobutanoate hydroxymethyltransferase